MLTNFISEAANEVYYPAAEPSPESAAAETADTPVIIRNLRMTEAVTETADIYERARGIYYRARRSRRVRAANIL
jgi:hypothetical protein